jgi:hypothetical protein
VIILKIKMRDENEPLLPSLSRIPRINPREESFCDMLSLTCCPQFRFDSFIFTITLIDIVVYTFSLFMGLSKEKFLSPSPSALHLLGEKVN